MENEKILSEAKRLKRKKPKICVVSWFHCLRNVKLAIGAWLNGYELELIVKPQGFTLMQEMQFLHIYKNVTFFDNASQLEYALKNSDADIFWCHNEPDMMTELCVQPEIKKDRLVLHDCHDLPTLHPGMEEKLAEQEKIAIEGADYTFVPTDDYITMIEKKYPKAKGKVITTFSCPPEIFFPDVDLPRVNGLLYCGQVNVPEMDSQLHYRNLLDLFYKCTELGVATHIYNTTPQANLMPYTMAGASVYGVLRMFAAIHQYTRYDYGFVGSSVDCQEIQICMPNKLFDCMAAGIPLINLNSGRSGKFCEDLGIGISVQGLNNFDSVPWDDATMWEGMRKKVREIRHEYTAENEMRKAFEKIGI